MFNRVLLQVLLVLVVMVVAGHCHGRMVNPPSRASMWRYGFDNPPDYNDNQGFCGGAQNQWTTNNGKCGICGDPYQGPRTHEPGENNKFANGIIVEDYSENQVIEVFIQITAHHKGYFEFRLCPSQDKLGSVTQKCLDRFVLELETGGTRFALPAPNGPTNNYSVRLRLPSGLRCSHCVLQWLYNAGNSWGCDEDGNCALGLGEQEQFRACSDISISSSGSPSSPSTSSVATTTTRATASPSMSKSSSSSSLPASSSSSSLPSSSIKMSTSTTSPGSTQRTESQSTSMSSPVTKTTKQDTITTAISVESTTKQPSECACFYKSSGPWKGMPSIDKWCVLMCPGWSCDHWSGCEHVCPDSC